ncbi:Transcriptional regulator [Fulvia fulva]|uniref:Transcriptional regulator n=1 Tax=Passalora fulva TaxID=5499 RepID=A0A9Q8PCW0_PASFU|nr:Transcriptional regulator [Fulvia fulva]KAK4620724.1 Transcriptional regulator [Fulvia fulva]UJO20211.1 Transcriptional regulator [Fulvia fulva]WPV32572.1 Transcriptional regulator [Fulvia fulva]
MTDARDGPLGIRKHQCEYCPKSFKRREHWQRHSRSHTNEKPFECRFCQKCFARRDLVTRHEKTLHANDGSPTRSPTGVRRPSTAIASNHLSPTSGKSGMNDVLSPQTNEPWDGIESLAATVSPTYPSTQAIENFEHYAAPSANGFEEFLDPALRMPSDGADAWDWTVTQPSQSANATVMRQTAEDPTASSSGEAAMSNNDQESAAVVPESVVKDLLNHTPGPSLIDNTNPPSTHLVRVCLAAYFESFNVHLPLIHQPTFQYTDEPPQLLLAMAAIGALYRLERKVATYLYLAAEASLPDATFVSDQTCADLFYAGDLASPDAAVDNIQTIKLADARTLLLLMLFGAFSGNREVSENAIGRQGRLANAYHSIARNVQRESQLPASSIGWSGWLRLESHRRLLHGIWVACNLSTAVYGIRPGVSVPLHGDVQLSCHDTLWWATTAAEWQVSVGDAQPSPTIKAAVEVLCSDDHATLAHLPTSSTFAVTVLMHAFSVHTWHSANSFGGSGSESILHGLSASRRLLQDGAPPLTGSIEPRSDFLFNASAISRIAYSRSCSALATTDRSAMLRGDTAASTAAMRDYIQEPIPRTPATLAAVENVFETFVFQDRGGILLIRKTAGLVWSFEHVIAAWDSVLLLTKWLHESSTDTESGEQALRDHVAATLEHEGCNIEPEGSMAAAVARFFSLFCDEWVWGVTARMGTVLRSIADLLEETHSKSKEP